MQRKTMDVVLALVLLSFAFIQLNDADPLFWVGLYGVAAVGPLITLFRPFSAPVSWIGVGYCLAGIALTLGGGVEYLRFADQEPLMQAMSPDKPYIEQAREVIGALITLIIIGAHFVLHRRSSKEIMA